MHPSAERKHMLSLISVNLLSPCYERVWEKSTENAERAASWITIAFALSPQAGRDMVTNSIRYSRINSQQCQERVATINFRYNSKRRVIQFPMRGEVK